MDRVELTGLFAHLAADAADLAGLGNVLAEVLAGAADRNTGGLRQDVDDLLRAGIGAHAAAYALVAVDLGNAVADLDGVILAHLGAVAQTDAAVFAAARTAEEVLDGSTGLDALVVHFLGRAVFQTGAHDVGDLFHGLSGVNAENGSDRCRSAGTAGHALVGRDGVVFGQSAGVVVAAYETAGTAVCAGQAFTDLNGRLVHGHGKDLAGYGQKDSSDEAGNDRQYDGSYESRCC